MRIDQLFPIVQDLQIWMPDGSPTGITLKVTSIDATAPHMVERAFAQAAIGEKPTVEAMENMAMDRAAACVSGWVGFEDDAGQPLPYSAEKCRELFRKPELSFLREQVEAYTSKRANFFRGSKAVS